MIRRIRKQLKNNIGDFVLKLMEATNCTQEELAKALGTNQGRVSTYATKKRIPKIDLLLKMSMLSGLTLQEIVDFNINEFTGWIYGQEFEKGRMLSNPFSSPLGLPEPRAYYGKSRPVKRIFTSVN